jgi:hypothetical protein
MMVLSLNQNPFCANLKTLAAWKRLSPEEQLELIQQLVDEEKAAGRIVELLSVNCKRKCIGAENWRQTRDQN